MKWLNDFERELLEDPILLWMSATLLGAFSGVMLIIMAMLKDLQG